MGLISKPTMNEQHIPDSTNIQISNIQSIWFKQTSEYPNSFKFRRNFEYLNDLKVMLSSHAQVAESSLCWSSPQSSCARPGVGFVPREPLLSQIGEGSED